MFGFSSIVIIHFKYNYIVSFDIKWNITLCYANFSEISLWITRFEMTCIFSPRFGKIHGKVYVIEQLRSWKQKWNIPVCCYSCHFSRSVAEVRYCWGRYWKLRPIFTVAFPVFYFGARVSQSRAKPAVTDGVADTMLADLWWGYPVAPRAGRAAGGWPAGRPRGHEPEHAGSPVF